MFGFLKSWFGGDEDAVTSSTSTLLSGDSAACINPATGLPMISDDCTGVDVGGSPYGSDLHDDTASIASVWDDGITSMSTGFDDGSFSTASSSDWGSNWD